MKNNARTLVFAALALAGALGITVALEAEAESPRVDATPLFFMTTSASASDSRRPTGFGASANDHAATLITAVSMASSRGSTLSNVSVIA